MRSILKRDALSTVNNNNNNNNNGNGFKRGGNCALAFDDDVDKEEESLLVLENRKRKSNVTWEDEDKIINKSQRHQHQRKLKNMRCDVEVRLKRDSIAKKSEVKKRVLEYFERSGMPTVRADEEISFKDDSREAEDGLRERELWCGDFV